MKKTHRLTAGLLCAILAAILVAPAAAHGCHGGRVFGQHTRYSRPAQTSVTVCPYEDCSIAGRHTHSGTVYCGYHHEGGFCDNACRALCPLEDCQIAGRHTHNGTTYCGYHHEDGFCDNTCRALCPLEDCETAGLHTHGTTTYCGYHHEGGFCDGSCADSVVSGYGHHRSHCSNWA